MERAFIARNWGLILLSGLLTLAFGIVILIWPAATTKVLLVFFGILALLYGVFHVVEAIMAARKQESYALELLLGLLEIVVGIVVLARPGVAIGGLLVLIVVWLIAIGFMDIFAAIESDASTGWRVFMGIFGLTSVVVGLVFVFRPGLGVWTVILVIGIYSIFVGLLRIVFAFLIRSWFKQEPPAAAVA